jgi:transcription antitermination protein NusB
MTSRRRAREAALQILYGLDANDGENVEAALMGYFDRFKGTEEMDEEGREPLDRSYAEAIVRDVMARRAELDELLGQVSRSWRPERMAQVDRNVLRIALWEMRHRTDIPGRVAINEAIELAKRFGAAEAPAFVNGILDSALKALEPKK